MIAARMEVAPVLANDDNLASALDWQTFSATYFPGSRRHNLEAIVAYGDYRQSLDTGDQPSETVGLTTGAGPVEDWEDEGGSLR